MSNARWTTLSLVLISATMLAMPLAARSLAGSIAGLCINAFAAGILFRGMIDARRSLRAKADALFDASVEDVVKVHRPGGGSGPASHTVAGTAVSRECQSGTPMP